MRAGPAGCWPLLASAHVTFVDGEARGSALLEDRRTAAFCKVMSILVQQTRQQLEMRPCLHLNSDSNATCHMT